MYFITNKEGLIIAASSEFMSKIGCRDICSLSHMFSDKIINLKNDNELSVKENNFSYTKATLHSPLGDLELYRLLEKNRQTIEADSDESITYLKKIKEGTIIKEDNEYSVPSIPTLEDKKADIEPTVDTLKEKDEKNRETKPNVNQEIIDTIHEIEENNNNYKASIAKINPQEKTVEIKENTTIDTIDSNKETVKQKVINIPEIPKEAIEESYSSVKIETKENIDTQKSNFTAKDYIKDEDENKKTDTINDLEDIFEDNNLENKKKKSLFSSSIFPWSKRKKEDLESLENKVKTEINKEEKSYLDIDNTINKSVSEKNEENIKEVQKVEESLEKENRIKQTTKSSIEDSDNIKSNDSFLNIFKSNQELNQKKTEQLEIKDEDVAVDTIDKGVLESKEIHEPLEIITNKETIDNELEILTNDETNLVENKNIDIQEQKSNIKEPEENRLISSEDILDKIVKIQVDEINLDENAKKLNIDLNSYKMLLKSYLSEIDTYLPKLKDSDNQTIDMLIDAGQLLSLDNVILKLNKIKSSDNEQKASKIEELEKFSKLLKDKISKDRDTVTKDIAQNIDNITEVKNKNNNVDTNIATSNLQEVSKEPKIVKIEDTYTTKVEEETIETEVESEIESAEKLLETVAPIEVNADPKIAAEELNLPTDLIIEFINDFLIQSKEHLPILVESYMNKDIQKVQSTAHMLKGAANNLRLNKIADNLFKIQKETKLENDKELIKKFVAQIKGLEIELEKIGE